MPAITTITNSGWLTSGSATAGNTGFSQLGTAIFGVDEAGEKFITTAATNTGLAVRVDPTASVFASGATRYHSEVVVYAEYTGQSGSDAIGSPSGFMLYLDNTILATLSLAALNSGYTNGLFCSFGGFGGATATTGVTGTSREPLPINRKITIGVHLDKTTGVAGFCVNGVRQGGWTATPTATWSPNVNYQLPAIPGVRWRIYASTARPAKSWSGSDHEFSVNYTDYPGLSPILEDGLSMCWPHTATDGDMGTFWTYSGTVTLANYESSGTDPLRKKFTAGSGGVTITSKMDAGTLPFNKYGDAAITTCLYVPSGGTWSIALRNAGNSADVLKIQVASGQLQNAAGTQLLASDGTAVAISTSKRYGLAICLSQAGYASFGLFDMTSDATTRLVWCNELSGGWTQQTIGKIIITASNTVEGDRVDICKWFTNAIVDSLVSTAATTTTPALTTTANNLGFGFSHSDALAIPGVAYQSSWYGWPKDSMMITSARSGRRRSDWITYSRQYLGSIRAMRLLEIDGGCYNDLNQDTTAATIMTYVAGDMDFVNRTNGELTLMSSFARPLALAGSLSVARQIQQRILNSLKRDFVIANAASARLYYCDHQRAYRTVMITTDGAHPSSGADSLCRAIAGTLMTARQFANAMNQPRNGIGVGL